MPIFEYEGMKSSGEDVNGTIEATDEADANTKLRADGIFATKLNLPGEPENEAWKNSKNAAAGPNDGTLAARVRFSVSQTMMAAKNSDILKRADKLDNWISPIRTRCEKCVFAEGSDEFQEIDKWCERVLSEEVVQITGGIFAAVRALSLPLLEWSDKDEQALVVLLNDTTAILFFTFHDTGPTRTSNHFATKLSEAESAAMWDFLVAPGNKAPGS